MRWNFWKQRENINLPGTWLYKVLQPSLFSSSILSFGEQSPEKGELRTKKWQTSPMLLTETYKDRPLDGPQGLLAWICPPSSRIWEKRPKMNLTSVVLMILRTLTLNSTKCKAHPTANKVVYDLVSGFPLNLIFYLPPPCSPRPGTQVSSQSLRHCTHGCTFLLFLLPGYGPLPLLTSICAQ